MGRFTPTLTRSRIKEEKHRSEAKYIVYSPHILFLSSNTRPRKVTRSVVKRKAMWTSLGQLRVALSHRELRSEPRYSVLLPLMIRDFVWVCGYEHVCKTGSYVCTTLSCGRSHSGRIVCTLTYRTAIAFDTLTVPREIVTFPVNNHGGRIYDERTPGTVYQR